MSYNPVFNKIKAFVEQEKSSTICVKEISGIYNVNDYTIENINNVWAIIDSSGNVINTFHYVRMSFLSVFAIIKKKTDKLPNLKLWDNQLSIYKHDVDMFIKRLQNNPENKVINDRLGNAEKHLLQVKTQIRNFEKEVGLFSPEEFF